MSAVKEVSLREVINPHPKQIEFMEATKRCKYVLYGGAAGGGKSYILRWSLVAWLMKWAKEGHKGVRVGLFCEDYPTLRDRHLSKVKFEFPEWLGKMRETVHEFELAERFGGGVIAFRNLDDPSKYLSSEFAAIAVDELTMNPLSTFDMLRMRMRWPGIERPMFLGATNPGGPGHGWVKQYWVDGNLPPELRHYANEFAFVRAKADDNPMLPASYMQDLATLPEKLRKAYLEGDWDIFEGQFFSEWRRELHVCDPFDVPADWTHFLAMDWGYFRPFAVLRLVVSPDNRLYVTGEYYGMREGRPNEGLRITASEAASEAKRRFNLLYGVADPACWNKTGNSGPSIAEEFSEAGIYFSPGDNSRVLGWLQVRERLKGDRPALQVFSTCQHLIRTLPALLHDTHKPEDLDSDGEDHLADALRYACMARPLVPKGPQESPKRPTMNDIAAKHKAALVKANGKRSNYEF